MRRADLPMTTWPMNNLVHGHASEAAGRTPTYRAWESMRARCLNPKARHYAYYGGRGIGICGRWESFGAFLADMGARPTGTTLDRIDNDGNYEPGNCRWATAKQQARNRRDTLLVAYKGRTQPLAAWCEELGLPYHTIRWRLRKGHSAETAFGAKTEGRKLTLTDADRAEIRALRGKVGQRALAKRFRIAVSTVCRVQAGQP